MSPQVLHVVVPARDEEADLPRTLDGLSRATTALGRCFPSVAVRTTVVLDLCVDGSAEVVATHPWAGALEVAHGNVGRARAAGVEHARALDAGVAGDAVWIACTDADTLVDEQWLVRQVLLAESGVDYYVGVVHPDSEHLDPPTWAAWWGRHHLVEGHAHVHGANLGFRLSAYDAVGGFEPVATGEDLHLVGALRASSGIGVASADNPVVTSARTVGRAPAGFAAYLARLDSADGAPA